MDCKREGVCVCFNSLVSHISFKLCLKMLIVCPEKFPIVRIKQITSLLEAFSALTFLYSAQVCIFKPKVLYFLYKVSNLWCCHSNPCMLE